MKKSIIVNMILKRSLRIIAIMSLFGLSPAYATGSLFTESEYKPLYADKRAFRVGDSLMILISESAKAESKAATGSERDTSISASARDSINQVGVGLGVGAGSSGDARTARQGFLNARLAASVVGKTDIGHLVIRGEQSIVINGEEQKITIFGKVRPEDIHKDNTIPSFRINEAKIEFSGDGVVSDAQKSGIVYRILSWLGVI